MRGLSNIILWNFPSQTRCLIKRSYTNPADWVETTDISHDLHNQQDGFIAGTNPIAGSVSLTCHFLTLSALTRFDFVQIYGLGKYLPRISGAYRRSDVSPVY